MTSASAATGADALDLAFAHAEAGRDAQAAQLCREVVAADAGCLDAWGLLACAMNRLADHAGAAKAAQTAILLDPDDADAWVNLGVARKSLMDPGGASVALRRALALEPDNAAAHVNLCDLLTHTGDYARALEHGRRAVELSPGLVAANWSIGYPAAKLGLWDVFWPSYDWRWRLPARQKHVAPEAKSLPYWQGGQGETIRHRRVLLWCEQGDGDAIMFARYVAEVANLGATVTLKCPERLERLFASLPCRVTSATRVDDVDCHCPLMSLPLALGRHEPYDAGNYLNAGTHHERNGRLRVGLRWAGSSEHANDRWRSLPMTAFETFRAIDATFVSLQYGTSPPPWMEDGVAGCRDYADTAAVVAGLDLVVTVDTSMAHLAGAMGKSVWVLLPAREPDWRWPAEGEQTPWYASMRLFRKDGVATAVERLKGML